MKNIIVLVICLLPFVSKGQNVIPAFNITPLIPVKGVKEYYENIRLAEHAVVRNDTIKALQYYAEAFKHKTSFITDYLNARLLFNNKPVVDSLVLLTFLKDRRAKYPDENYDVVLDELIKKHPQLNTSFVNHWKINRTIQIFPFNSSTDSVLTKTILKLEKNEQDLRNVHGKFAHVDSINLWELVRLYNEHGDITEQQVGRRGLQAINLMLFHISRYPFTEWIPIITEQTLKGHFPNKWYAELIDSYIKNNISKEKEATCFYFNGGFPLTNKYLLLKETNKKFIQDVNERRTKFFLDIYQDQQAKQLWNFRHGFTINFYEFFSYGGIFPGATQEDIDKAYKEQDKFIADFRQKFGDDFLIFNKEDNNYEINLWKKDL